MSKEGDFGLKSRGETEETKERERERVGKKERKRITAQPQVRSRCLCPMDGGGGQEDEKEAGGWRENDEDAVGSEFCSAKIVVVRESKDLTTIVIIDLWWVIAKSGPKSERSQCCSVSSFRESGN